MSARDAAIHYLALGFNVLPLGPGSKEPLIRWKHLQQSRASIAEVHDWFRRWPSANVGLITGEISDLVVVDHDVRNGVEPPIDWGLPPTVRTPGGGSHRYYCYSGSRTVHGVAKGIDLQSDGAYVCAPPSIHPNGGTYAFVAGRGLTDPPLLPLLPEAIAQLEAEHTYFLPPERPPVPESPWRGIGLDDALAILEDTGKVTRTGPLQFMACCPLHQDAKPSLAVSLGDNGRLLLHCFAGCGFYQLLGFFIKRTTGEVR